MIIPNKFNGFYGGVRRCFGGGGGGGGGGDGAGDGGGDAGGPNDVYTLPTNINVTNTGNTTFNPNRGSITGMNFTGGNNTAGTSTIPRDNLNLRNMAGMPYNQVGQQYNALLQQGFTGNDIRNALTTNGRPVSDSDYGALVQNAAMTSPTGRPMAGSDQFFQPVYNTSYQNYANPLTAFNTSTYGTTPARSNASQWWQNQGATDQQYMDRLRSQAPSYQNMNIGDLAQNMQQFGISPSDMQAAGSYGGSTYGGFNPGGYTPQMQTPFNPYTNSSGYGGYMPQMQTPFSYQQQSYQPSYQQSYQPSYQPQYNPYQMQSPFSYQQPTPQRTSSGPSQAIVGRSSQMRGTPNVMRRAEGGIASLMDDVE
jgi:hypothetical protein